jgi:hypothetical protein
MNDAVHVPSASRPILASCAEALADSIAAIAPATVRQPRIYTVRHASAYSGETIVLDLSVVPATHLEREAGRDGAGWYTVPFGDVTLRYRVRTL